LRGPVPGQARRLMLWAWVEPGWHYRGFFQARLDADPRGPAAEQYKAALDKARDGAYMLFSTTIPVSGQSGKQP
ncbi:MAG: hypothetical protein OEZ59_10440, partial [Deltaproteobacteria bacterium]|nr:hypothetical protein [Deltaproteobacteria bacterium]